MKEGAKTILGKCFSSQLDITNIRKLTVPIKIGTVIKFIYLLLSIAFTSIATASFADMLELK